MNWHVRDDAGERIEELTGPPHARKICLALGSRGIRPLQDAVYGTNGTINAHIRGPMVLARKSLWSIIWKFFSTLG
jgi:hypothetical protein